MIKKILIPLDGSDTAEAILPQVRRILKRHEAEVLVLRVVSTFPPDYHLKVPEIIKDAERYVRRKTFELINDGIPARAFVRLGPAAQTILDLATEERVSLIAMSTHGRSGMSRWVMGSVTEKVLRSSPVPALVARSFPPPLDGGISRGRMEELPLHNILVPLDGSDLALSALPFVKEFGRAMDMRVTLLNVIEADPYSPHWSEPFLPLDEPRKELIDECIPVTTEHRSGDAAEQILKSATEYGCDLIVMSTHGRSGPSRWVFGSVTEKVLRASTVPMLVIPGTRPPAGRSKVAKEHVRIPASSAGNADYSR